MDSERFNKCDNYLQTLNRVNKKTKSDDTINVLKELHLSLQDSFVSNEAYVVYNVLPTICKRFNDNPKVYDEVLNMGLNYISKFSIQTFPLIFRLLADIIDNNGKWKIKIGCLELLKQYIIRIEKYDRDLLSVSLSKLIPSFRDMVHDTKQEVSDLSVEVLTLAMSGLTNKDLEPFIPQLIKAMRDPEQIEETIQQIGGVVFVQTIESCALSVMVSLMENGFRHSKFLIQRLCARIVSNMSKLVEDPIEAEPFLEALISSLEYCADTIANPEVREVATTTLQTLLNIDAQAKKAMATENNKYRTIENITTLMNSLIENGTNELVINYVSNILCSLISTKTTDKDEYINELTPYLTIVNGTSNIDRLYEVSQKAITITEETEDDDNENMICNCEFTLAYGTKVLLRNTRLRLRQGSKYGLLGQNDCGKTTLMRAIADGSIDGFPDNDEVKCVFVEADIQGELSHLNCVDYVLNSPSILNSGISEIDVRGMLMKVGFSEGKSAGSGGDCDDPISSLSGGWRMKLALARAMLQKADIILMDEPTNHLDVKNVKWVKNYINSLTTTTVILVSHDSGLLEDCCDYILQIDQMKLKLHKGNLSEFVKNNPEAKSYFEFKANKYKFTFPKPSFLEGVKSRGKVLLKMNNVTFTYPGNTKPTINNITIKASMSSRVACVGVNGAGKSTMIKVLTGQLEPTTGEVCKYQNAKIGYIAQHAFHHIENHLDKTPNQYIRWRYALGNDREGLDKASMKLSEEEEVALKQPVEYKYKVHGDKNITDKRVVSRCTGMRRECEGNKKLFEYEVSWENKSMEQNSWLKESDLLKFSPIYAKVVRMINQKIESQENVLRQPLTEQNIERHLKETGLESEYATHFRIGALSGGQKVKVVLAAAMWDQPHILILDEPTNYLDRDSLGALADSIENYEGGVIMITHNDAFCRQLCPERWVLEAGFLNTEGDVDWMDKASKQEVEFEQLEEIVDASGNEVKLKKKKKLNAKEKKKMIAHIKKKITDGEDLDSDEEDYAIEFDL
jgi:elongation factor 3